MRVLRILVGYLLLALVCAGLLLLDVWPWHPTSWRVWLLFAVLALPTLLAGEWVADKLLTNPVSRWVDRATAKSSFSWLRIAYVFAMAVVVLGVLFVAQHLWGQ